jgi:RES domain-containing protein
MEVFRISTKRYSGSLSSSGTSNRWNFTGENVIYTGSSRSLATLELVVHRNAIKPAGEYKVMVISIADDDHLFRQIQASQLPQNWRSNLAYAQLQQIGSDWITRKETLILKVPSAIIPQEYNYIINTEHPAFRSKVKLIRSEDYFWDSRLL